MKYLLTMLLIFLLSVSSTFILCSITTFANFNFLFFNFLLFLSFGIFFYHIVIYAMCKFLENKYDV
jgi:hypothetical protein